VPTFRGAGGLWEGHRFEDVATPEAWLRDPALVRRFYDERRVGMAHAKPNAGHYALARLQAERPNDVTLVTQNIDGLLTEVGCTDVIEMHGAIRSLRCSWDEGHPWVPVSGYQDAAARCACGGPLRPAIVWFGEVPYHLDRIFESVARCDVFVSVGTSGVVYPAAGLVEIARKGGAARVEINPEPAGGPFDTVIAEGGEVALPRLVEQLLAGKLLV
jgi:NAD-dependent deacetylase